MLTTVCKRFTGHYSRQESRDVVLRGNPEFTRQMETFTHFELDHGRYAMPVGRLLRNESGAVCRGDGEEISAV